MQITPIVKNIIIINVAIFLGDWLFSSIPLHNWFSLYFIEDPRFSPFQFITYMFLHGSFMHILFNMLVLFFIGPMIERFFGQKRFLIFFLIAGIGSAIIYTGVNYYKYYQKQKVVNSYVESPSAGKFISVLNEFKYQRNFSGRYYQVADQLSENPDNSALLQKSRSIIQRLWNNYSYPGMVGASGAIYGILVAFAMLFPNTQLMLFPIPVPVKAKYFVPFLVLISIIMGAQDNPGDNVAHFAHLGGAITGFITLKIWNMDRSNFY